MGSAQAEEIILAKGHGNILATHPTTLELTKSNHLSTRGDCIIAVSADKAALDLSAEFKEKLCRESAQLVILIESGRMVEMINAYGNANLTLVDPKEIVVRKSSYVSGRTLAVRADKAAADLSRNLVRNLKDPAHEVRITLIVNADTRLADEFSAAQRARLESLLKSSRT